MIETQAPVRKNADRSAGKALLSLLGIAPTDRGFGYRFAWPPRAARVDFPPPDQSDGAPEARSMQEMDAPAVIVDNGNPGVAGGPVVPIAEDLRSLVQRLALIEDKLDRLIRERTVKAWYTTAEVSGLLDRTEFTVREWCRLGRVNAKKRQCGRGLTQEWVISHAELDRIRNEGLLPVQRF